MQSWNNTACAALIYITSPAGCCRIQSCGLARDRGRKPSISIFSYFISDILQQQPYGSCTSLTPATSLASLPRSAKRETVSLGTEPTPQQGSSKRELSSAYTAGILLSNATSLPLCLPLLVDSVGYRLRTAD